MRAVRFIVLSMKAKVSGGMIPASSSTCAALKPSKVSVVHDATIPLAFAQANALADERSEGHVIGCPFVLESVENRELPSR